jgi:hypothetical protein
MAKRKGVPDDGIQKLIEWEEHQYNSGYWINRFSPFFPQKRIKFNWILSLVDFYLIIPAFILFLIVFIQTNEKILIAPLILLGVFSIIVVLRKQYFTPVEDKNNGEEENNLKSATHHHYKKKLLKRRKDYR